MDEPKRPDEPETEEGDPDPPPIVDRITTASLVVDADGMKLAGVRFEFSRSGPDGPIPVGAVVLVGPPEMMRKVGKLVRDTAYGAANACEKALELDGGNGRGPRR